MGKRKALALVSLAALAVIASIAWCLWTGDARSGRTPIEALPSSRPAAAGVEAAHVLAPAAAPELVTEASDVTLAPALTPAREEAQPSELGGSRIAGRVVDELGAGIPRPRLYLKRGPRETVSIPGDADGNFVSAPLAPGTWRIHVYVEGFDEASELVKVPPGAGALRLVLRRRASVAGVVLDPYGAPVPAAEVKCRGWEGTSDERGEFSVINLGPGRIAFVASADEFLDSPEVALELEEWEQRAGVVLQLRPAGKIEGLLLRANGEPEPEEDVHVHPAWGEELSGKERSSETDAEGRFAFVLAPGRWTLRAVTSWPRSAGSSPDDDARNLASLLNGACEATVEVREGETAQVVLGGPSRSALRLHGRVTSAGKPLAGALISLLRERAPLIGATRMAFSGPGGEYELVLDAPGTYMVFASPGGSVDSGTQLVRQVAIHGDLALDLDVPAGRVRGRVVVPPGADPSSARVDLFSESGPVEFQSFSHRRCSPDVDGRFGFEPLPAGSYGVRAALGPWVSPVAALRLGRGEARDDLVLRLVRAGRLEGRVLLAHGEPATEARAGLVDARGTVVVPVSSTDDGSFSWDEVPPGTFTLLARTAELAAVDSTVVVEEGATTHRALVLQPAGRLRIRVLEPDGLPATLEVLDARGTRVFPILDEDASEGAEHGMEAGVQVTPALLPGDYRVRAFTELARGERSVRVIAGQVQDVTIALER
jgi:hypothetical protein